jgi:L-glutamine-phosphate cytidylyltransferase
MTQVIILNSGLGSRMNSLTVSQPKCLVELVNGDTLISRQLKLLCKLKLTDVIITTGPFEAKIRSYLIDGFEPFTFTLVHNPRYRETNYIYSLLLTEDKINRDVILMHGDMVFEQGVLDKLIKSKYGDAVLVNPSTELPEKDFKAEITGGRIRKIAVDIFGPKCIFLLPIYKLTKETLMVWFKEMRHFEKQGILSVYAEDALNNLLDNLVIHPVNLKDEFCMEVDDEEDLEIARRYLVQKGEQ